MFSTEKYVNLFVDEYLGYALKNLAKENNKLKRSPEKEKFNEELSIRVKEVIKKYVNVFETTISDNAIKKMEADRQYLRNEDPKHTNNNYNIFLDDTIIAIGNSQNAIYVIIQAPDMLIKINFDINNYWKNKSFIGSWYGMVFNNDDKNYMMIKDSDILVYSRETIDLARNNAWNINILTKPDAIIVNDGDVEQVFLEQVKDSLIDKKAHK